MQPIQIMQVLYWQFECDAVKKVKVLCWYSGIDVSGAQPGIFEGRGGFCKLGHKFLAVLKVKCKHKVRFFQL